MSQPAAITAAILDKILGLLAPLFLTAAGGDVAVARDAASAMLANYNVRNDNELRLAALVIAFGLGALDALSQAANPDLSLNQIMRLRGTASALSRAGHRNQAELDKQRKQPPPEPETQVEEAALPASIDAQDLVAFARAAAQARTQSPAAPLSRQQRRAAERQAEKARRRQEHEARRAAQLAARPIPRHAAS